jgi:hypothetical protein
MRRLRNCSLILLPFRWNQQKNGFYVVNIQDNEMLVAEKLVPRPGQDKGPEWGFVRRVPLKAP